MIIYLEGPDGSGKTTLANKIAKLCEEQEVQIVPNGETLISTHPNRPDRITKENLFASLDDMAKSNTVYILDRGPISDSIYRMFDNYEPVCKLEDIAKSFAQYLVNKQAIIIYTRSDKAEEAMLARGDDNPVALRRHKELTKAYDLIMGVLNMTLRNTIMRFDFSKPSDTEDILQYIETQIKLHKTKED